jgi:hypothetical protein
MSRPTVLVLSFSRIATDARVLKQVRLLSEHFDVTTCGHGPQPEGTVNHVEVPEDLQAWVKDARWLMLRQYRRVYGTNPAVRYARDRLRGLKFDAILANDVEAVPLALELQPRGGVHADLHEYAPGQRTELPRWRWFVAPYYRWLCRTYVTRATSVTTVGPAIADRYRREFGFETGVVMNATPYVDLPTGSVTSPLRLVHSGNAMVSRGLLTVIDAVEASRAPVTLDLYLMPNEPEHLTYLKGRTAPSGRVRVLDPVPYAELVRTLNAYDVGIHLLPPINENNRWALPNKLFDYVQARLGVVVGPSPEMAAIVRERGLGAVAAGFSAADLTAVLDELTPERVAGWKAASAAAARDLSADAQSVPWLDAIAKIVGVAGE